MLQQPLEERFGGFDRSPYTLHYTKQAIYTCRKTADIAPKFYEILLVSFVWHRVSLPPHFLGTETAKLVALNMANLGYYGKAGNPTGLKEMAGG